MTLEERKSLNWKNRQCRTRGLCAVAGSGPLFCRTRIVWSEKKVSDPVVLYVNGTAVTVYPAALAFMLNR